MKDNWIKILNESIVKLDIDEIKNNKILIEKANLNFSEPLNECKIPDRETNNDMQILEFLYKNLENLIFENQENATTKNNSKQTSIFNIAAYLINNGLNIDYFKFDTSYNRLGYLTTLYTGEEASYENLINTLLKHGWQISFALDEKYSDTLPNTALRYTRDEEYQPFIANNFSRRMIFLCTQTNVNLNAVSRDTDFSFIDELVLGGHRKIIKEILEKCSQRVSMQILLASVSPENILEESTVKTKIQVQSAATMVHDYIRKNYRNLAAMYIELKKDHDKLKENYDKLVAEKASPTIREADLPTPSKKGSLRISNLIGTSLTNAIYPTNATSSTTQTSSTLASSIAQPSITENDEEKEARRKQIVLFPGQ